tara:strand:- start:46 stop:348 length:303 start_codon:yes stop_codon:yes gene_type:complete
MVIYPDIEIQNGRCVNLHRGHMQDPIIYDISPLKAARQHVAKGAQLLHVVDLDNVMRGGHDNHKAVVEIIQQVDCQCKLVAVSAPLRVRAGGLNRVHHGW